MSENSLLFSYGQIREQHTDRKILIADSNGLPEPLYLQQFIRREFLQRWQDAISHDKLLMSDNLCAATQLALSPISRQSIWELHSGIMLRLLETITGKQNLLPDSHGCFSRFWQPPIVHCEPASWQDSDTGLQGAINLLVMFNGDALILSHSGSVTESSSPADTQEGVLQLLYFSHGKEAS